MRDYALAKGVGKVLFYCHAVGKPQLRLRFARTSRLLKPENFHDNAMCSAKCATFGALSLHAIIRAFSGPQGDVKRRCVFLCRLGREAGTRVRGRVSAAQQPKEPPPFPAQVPFGLPHGRERRNKTA